jgi:polysaccharide biosynthesis/export protein VpsN
MKRHPNSSVSRRPWASASAIDLLRNLFSVVLLAALAAACQSKPVKPALPLTQIPAGDLSAYRLGVGDRVRISVYGEPDLSLDAEVEATGNLGYPLLGSIPAVRKTANELAAELAKRLSKGYLVNPDVRVTVVQYRPIYVTGQVARAGAYPYTVGLTVEKALVLAGGMTRLGSARGIYRLPEDAPVSERHRVRLDGAVFPGDTLVVEESLF